MSPVAEAAPPVTESGPTFKEFWRVDHDIDNIVASPFQTREHFDDGKLAELAKTIAHDGMIQPLVLRIVRGNTYELVAGERRWRAARLAGLKTVPVIVRPLTDAQAARIVVIENDQREEVTALERAKGYSRLMQLDPRYRDRKVLAEELGKSVSWVHAAMKLLELHPAVQKALLAGAITEGHAILIARLQPADQLRALQACAPRGPGIPGGAMVGVRALKEWIAREVHMDLDAAPFKKDDADLVKAAGACSACPKRAGANAELFDDVKKANTCTDRSCYDLKIRAFGECRLAELSAPGRPAVLVTRAYYIDSDAKKRIGVPVVSNEGWREAGKKDCPNTRQALVVDSQTETVHYDRVLSVCLKPRDCAVHAEREKERAPSASERAEATRRKTLEQKRRTEGNVRRAILGEVRERVTELRVEDLRLVANRFLHEMHADRQKDVYGHMGWPALEKKKNAGGGLYGVFRTAAEAQLAKASPADLAKFLMVASLSAAAAVSLNPYYGEPDEALLLDAAKRWKVDAAAIEKRVRSGAVTACPERPGPLKLELDEDGLKAFDRAYSGNLLSGVRPRVNAVVHDGLLYTVQGVLSQGGGGLPKEIYARRLYLRAAWPFKTKVVTDPAKTKESPDGHQTLTGYLVTYKNAEYVIGPERISVVAQKGVQTSAQSKPAKAAKKSTAKKKR